MNNLHDVWKTIRANVEIAAVVVLGLVVGLGWLLAELTDEVIEGSTQTLDRTILLLMREPDNLSSPLGPAWLQEIGRDLTALGGVAVLTIMTLVVGFYFVMQRRFATALFLWFAVGSGILLSTFAKAIFDRARPDLVPHGSIVTSSSFPSGHSMMAAICYLTLGVLLARVQPTRGLRVFVMAVAILLTLMVGVSRVYLGVHWPTDVAAGWLAGAFWALVCMLIAKAISLRGDSDERASGT